MDNFDYIYLSGGYSGTQDSAARFTDTIEIEIPNAGSRVVLDQVKVSHRPLSSQQGSRAFCSITGNWLSRRVPVLTDVSGGTKTFNEDQYIMIPCRDATAIDFELEDINQSMNGSPIVLFTDIRLAAPATVYELSFTFKFKVYK